MSPAKPAVNDGFVLLIPPPLRSGGGPCWSGMGGHTMEDPVYRHSCWSARRERSSPSSYSYHNPMLSPCPLTFSGPWKCPWRICVSPGWALFKRYTGLS